MVIPAAQWNLKVQGSIFLRLAPPRSGSFSPPTAIASYSSFSSSSSTPSSHFRFKFAVRAPRHHRMLSQCNPIGHGSRCVLSCSHVSCDSPEGSVQVKGGKNQSINPICSK